MKHRNLKLVAMNGTKVSMALLATALLAIASPGFGGVDTNEPPRNPYLADSPWPMTHRNPYCQASSPLPGPVAADFAAGRIKVEIAKAEAVAVTLNVTPKNEKGTFSIIGSARETIFKVDANGGRWERTATTHKPGQSKHAISGAYTVLDHEGHLFVPREKSILAYREARPGHPNSQLQLAAEFKLPENAGVQDNERIVGINMTWDGFIAIVTNRSLVAIFTRDGALTAHLRLAEDEEVSNSLAIDEDGGVYAVTEKQVYRVNWNGENLSIAWQAPYPTSDTIFPGRLGRGSGTTPTLMGTGTQDKLVLIADGTANMNIVAFWRDQIPQGWHPLPGFSERIAGIAPIRFGDPARQRAITEQSLLVRGYDAVAVNNDYGESAARGNSNFWTILFSNKKKYAPWGIEKFRWNPQSRMLTSVWANSTLSVPNGIPTMSSATGLIYYLGQHDESWTIEGVDWETGKLAFRHRLADAIRFNSFYAGMEIGYDSSLLSGVVGGAVRMLPVPKKSQPRF